MLSHLLRNLSRKLPLRARKMRGAPVTNTEQRPSSAILDQDPDLPTGKKAARPDIEYVQMSNKGASHLFNSNMSGPELAEAEEVRETEQNLYVNMQKSYYKDANRQKKYYREEPERISKPALSKGHQNPQKKAENEKHSS
jgi:hypothetical protein